jgi:acyl-coenzyme A synthetase/AMP-(fatty) acid ligase
LLSEPQDVPAADLLLCATAPLSPQLAALAEERFAAPLYEIYGCTEAGQIAARRTVETPEWQTLGSLSLHQDAAGTWAAGGHAEKAVLLADVIELRDARTFLLHGRTAGLVNIAGKRTSLANLDYHLNSVEGVRDGAFVMPDEADGAVARLMAFVVAPGVSGDSIMQALRQRIDAVFLPRPLYLVESLPRDSTGKLPRSALDYLRIGLARKAG